MKYTEEVRGLDEWRSAAWRLTDMVRSWSHWQVWVHGRTGTTHSALPSNRQVPTTGWILDLQVCLPSLRCDHPPYFSLVHITPAGSRAETEALTVHCSKTLCSWTEAPEKSHWTYREKQEGGRWPPLKCMECTLSNDKYIVSRLTCTVYRTAMRHNHPG